jgi:hypothetical protein
MKKSILNLTAIIFLTFISCKKSVTCVCTTTSTAGNSTTTTTTSKEISKTSKKNAKAMCGNSSTYSIVETKSTMFPYNTYTTEYYNTSTCAIQ